MKLSMVIERLVSFVWALKKVSFKKKSVLFLFIYTSRHTCLSVVSFGEVKDSCSTYSTYSHFPEGK